MARSPGGVSLALEIGQQVGELLAGDALLQPLGHQGLLACRDLVDLAEDRVFLAERLAEGDAGGRLRGDQAGEHAAVLGRDGVGGEPLRDLVVRHEDVEQDRLLGLVADAEQVGPHGEPSWSSRWHVGALASEDRAAAGRGRPSR